MKTRNYLFILSALLLTATTSNAAATLVLDSYLSEVAEHNQNYKGTAEVSKGAAIHADDAEVILYPSLFADFRSLKDKKPTDAPFFQGTETDATAYDIGISEMTNFGLSGKFTYSLSHVDLINATTLAVPDYHLASPSFELDFSLLKNGFGSGVRAQEALSKASNHANSYSNGFLAQSEMVNAELSYWRLASARKAVQVQSDALDRAQKIVAWATKRVKLQLGDRADELQATASLELAKVQLKMAQEEETAASFAFNSARNVNGSEVPEKLAEIDPDQLIALELPARVGMRLDVKASDEQRKIAIANSELSRENVKPTLDLFGSVAWNGRDKLEDPAIRAANQGLHPTQAYGVKFSTPLAFGLMKNNFKGTEMEQEGAELIFQKKLLDQEQSWQDLVTKLKDAQARLELTRRLEVVQKEKLENEHQRLLRGRTTTYQELLFEQDFDQAELQRLNTQSEVLRVYAQMKLFRGEK